MKRVAMAYSPMCAVPYVAIVDAGTVELVRSLGVVPGILAATIPFGLLHFQEYGNSWRHAVLIALAGASFGWMRQATGSTRAAAIMHASYNALFFFVLFAQRRELPHIW